MAAIKMRQKLEARQAEEEEIMTRVPLSRDQVGGWMDGPSWCSWVSIMRATHSKGPKRFGWLCHYVRYSMPPALPLQQRVVAMLTGWGHLLPLLTLCPTRVTHTSSTHIQYTVPDTRTPAEHVTAMAESILPTLNLWAQSLMYSTSTSTADLPSGPSSLVEGSANKPRTPIYFCW
jgi:hypothetical protein